MKIADLKDVRRALRAQSDVNNQARALARTGLGRWREMKALVQDLSHAE